LFAVAAFATLTGQSTPAASRAGSPAKPYTTWRSYSGGAHSSQYSALDQINKKNVAQLDIAWTYPVTGTIIFNPVVVDGVMYVPGGGGTLAAIDAATGKEIWKKTGIAPGARGMNYWENGDRSDRRFLFLSGGGLTAINAQTGDVITSFGTNGRVDLRDAMERKPPGAVNTGNPGRIYQNLYIQPLPAVGASYGAFPADVHAYDVITGKLAWVFHSVPHEGEFGYDTWPAGFHKRSGGVHNWSEFTIDEANGIAFINFGSPRFDFYGGDRKGDNLFGNSLVALDARTGKRLWHQQLIHHDLWDYDLPQAPKLLTIRQNNKPIDIVAQATKHGFLFVFERKSGRPIWPIEERKVPQSDVPGEFSSPTQPYPTKPEAFARQSFTEKDINPYLPQAQQDALRARMKTLRNEGLFTPPSFEGSIQLPGHNGGANFGTSAVDPINGEFYVVHKSLPTVLRIALPAPPGGGGRGGGGGPGGGGGGRGGGPAIVTPEQKAEMMAQAKDLVAKAGPNGYIEFPSPYEFMTVNFDGGSMAAIGPPWSEMVKYDLNTGDVKWRIPTGSVNAPPEYKMPGNTGAQFPRNGPVVTAGGLIFLATGPERKVRAYDRDTGKELWVRELPTGSEGMPATYEANGRQFVVFPVASAGGSFAATFNQGRGGGPGPAGAGGPPAAAAGAPPAPGVTPPAPGAPGGPPDAAAGQGGRGGRGGRGAGGGGGAAGVYIAFALSK
jgi:quinoprotein glucose dehydrogenase